MTELLAFLALGFLAGLLGGLVGGRLFVSERLRTQAILQAAGPLTVPVQLRTQPVTLRVAVTEPEPITIPLETGPAPSMQELAQRVLAVVPAIGPTDLASILNCSKSTAHGIISEWRTTRTEAA